MMILMMILWKPFSLLALLSLSTGCQAATIAPSEIANTQAISQAARTGQRINEAQIWQTDEFLKKYAQAQLRGGIPVGEDGAFGKNREQPEQVQVGWQRAGFEGIAFGVATRNKAIVQRGLSVFRWAFERQSPDGTFGVSQYPEVISFLGAYSRSLLFLRDAGLTAEAQELDRYLPQMKRYLNNHNVPGWEKQFEDAQARKPMTNQLFWAAFSYHVIHLIQPNPRLDNKAKNWLKLGLSNQQADGSFSEKRGGDTTYQNVSLRFLTLYSFYSPQSRNSLKPRISKGFDWLYKKVLPDGTFDTSQNTRTARSQEVAPTGGFKDGRFNDPLPSIYWSYLGGSQTARQMATRIVEARKMRSPRF